MRQFLFECWHSWYAGFFLLSFLVAGLQTMIGDPQWRDYKPASWTLGALAALFCIWVRS